MKLLDVLTAPWAIQPDKLLEIQAIYATHLRGERIDIAAAEQRLGRPLVSEAKPYEIVDGVAIVGMHGVIAKRANLFMQISGGVSSELVARDLRSAAEDPAVSAIILSIDSPGGTVDGTQTLAQIVREVQAEKPVVAFASGVMASAAYWIGSAASAVYIADGTTQVGSIGVVASHVDVSVAESNRGVKTTEIVAGSYKRIASSYAPLSEAGRASMQQQVDYLYGLFVEAVADHRGTTPDVVLRDMADGRVFTGQQAIDAGLVDSQITLQALVRQLSQGGAPASHLQPHQGASMSLTREQLAAQAPDLLQAVLDEGRAAGATAERQRILDVEAQAMPGHDALIQQLKTDGKTTGAEAAVAVLKAERQVRATAAQNLDGDAPKPVPAAATPAVEPVAGQEDASLPVEQRCQASWDRDPAIRAEFGSVQAYTAYVRAEEAGKVRVLKQRA